MLRASSRGNDALDIQSVVDPEAESGVPHGGILTAFAESAVRRSDDLPECREDIVAAIGEPALIDAAGIVANFQRMVRIADACGIPLDDWTRKRTADAKEQLHLDRFKSAANTPSN